MHERSTGLMEKLLAVPQQEITRLRKGLARAALHVAYAFEDGYGDAVDTMLAGVLRVVQNDAIIAHNGKLEGYGIEAWRYAESMEKASKAFCRRHPCTAGSGTVASNSSVNLHG